MDHFLSFFSKMVRFCSIIRTFIFYVLVQSLYAAKTPIPIPDLGSNQVIKGINVHGAIIVGDQTNEQRVSYSSMSAAAAGQVDYVHNDVIRNTNFKQLTSLIPVPLSKWPTVYARPCPHYSHSHKSSDKGNGLSHYQIWLEFIFFDHDLLEAVTRKPPEYLISNAWSSNSGTFQSFPNGTFTKNGIPFLEDDIIIILEDSAYTAVNNTLSMMEVFRDELSTMNTDLLHLGWCTKDTDSPTSHVKKASKLTQSCMYAYAVTRRGARILAKNYDICGYLPLDEQIANFVKYGWLTTRRVKSVNYKSLPRDAVLLPDEDVPRIVDDKTSGLFFQLKDPIPISVGVVSTPNDATAPKVAPTYA